MRPPWLFSVLLRGLSRALFLRLLARDHGAHRVRRVLEHHLPCPACLEVQYDVSHEVHGHLLRVFAHHDHAEHREILGARGLQRFSGIGRHARLVIRKDLPWVAGGQRNLRAVHGLEPHEIRLLGQREGQEPAQVGEPRQAPWKLENVGVCEGDLAKTAGRDHHRLRRLHRRLHPPQALPLLDIVEERFALQTRCGAIRGLQGGLRLRELRDHLCNIGILDAGLYLGIVNYL